MAKNSDVIQSFIKGGNTPKTKNLKIVDDKLINYNTTIAERFFDGDKYLFTVNVTKYSQSTSTIQNKLKSELNYNGISFSTVEQVPIGSKNI